MGKINKSWDIYPLSLAWVVCWRWVGIQRWQAFQPKP